MADSVPASSPDWERIRRDFPCTAETVYLQTGTLGPVPVPVFEQYQDYVREWNMVGPGASHVYGQWHKRSLAARERLAAWLGVSASSVTLTDNVTDAITLALTEYDLAPGDRVLTTDQEHPALVAPLGRLAQHGVRVDIVPLGDGGDSFFHRLEQALLPSATLVAMSHVSAETGTAVNAARLAALVHAHGAHLLLDGAQAMGQVDVNLAAADVDVYGITGHKWLMGPVGTGALYWSPRLEARRRELPAADRAPYPAGVASTWVSAPHHYAAATRAWTALTAWADSMGYRDAIGRNQILQRQRMLAKALADRLTAIPGLQLYSPYPSDTGITAAGLPGWKGSQLARSLAERGIAVRAGRATVYEGVRFSTAFFNGPADLDRAAEAMEFLAAATPPTD